MKILKITKFHCKGIKILKEDPKSCELFDQWSSKSIFSLPIYFYKWFVFGSPFRQIIFPSLLSSTLKMWCTIENQCRKISNASSTSKEKNGWKKELYFPFVVRSCLSNDFILWPDDIQTLSIERFEIGFHWQFMTMLNKWKKRTTEIVTFAERRGECP